MNGVFMWNDVSMRTQTFLAWNYYILNYNCNRIFVYWFGIWSWIEKIAASSVYCIYAMQVKLKTAFIKMKFIMNAYRKLFEDGVHFENCGGECVFNDPQDFDDIDIQTN